MARSSSTTPYKPSCSNHRNTAPSNKLSISTPLSCKSTVSSPPAMAETSNTIPVLAMAMALVMILMVQATQAQCPTSDLSPCLPAAQADVQPTEECCTNLAAYTETETPGECMCEGVLNSSIVDDGNSNAQFIVLIPQKCNLEYPAGITCRGYVIPGGQ